MLPSWIEAVSEQSLLMFAKVLLKQIYQSGGSQTSVHRMLYFTFCKYITVLM